VRRRGYQGATAQWRLGVQSRSVMVSARYCLASHAVPSCCFTTRF